MANETMTLISTVTVGSGGATGINFGSIPGSFTDLLVKISSREASTANFAVSFGFNTTALNQTSRFLQGTGSSVSSSSTTDVTFLLAGNSATSNTFGSAEIYIPNYAGSTFKSLSIDSVSENNATLSFQRLTAGLWSNTAAITSINLGAGTLFAEYSSASLYGILKGSGGATVS